MIQRLHRLLIVLSIAALVVSVSAIAQTQVPNVFEDGTPASAAEVNENFQYVLENASGGGGCSATQQDNSVVIECADGTSGVIAGAGTMVVVPEGYVGDVPTETVPQGQIVAVDGEGNIISGQAINIDSDENGVKNLQTIFNTAGNDRAFTAVLVNDRGSNSAHAVPTEAFYRRDTYIRFIEEDCQGASGVSIYPLYYFRYGGKFAGGADAGKGQCGNQLTLFRSYKLADKWLKGSWVADNNCYDALATDIFCPIVDVTPPALWAEIIYPIGVQQLP